MNVTSEPAVRVDRLTKRYGHRAAVDELSFELPRGVVAGFIGPNGAGKTTTMAMLLGLVAPTSGGGAVLGRPLDEPAAFLPQVGALIEGPAMYPGLTATENLRVLAAMGRRDPTRIPAVLELVGLTERAHDRFREFSMGMKQRLGIAGALLGDPELLILDEPTNGLDPAGILEFRKLVRRLVGEGRTVVLSSHLLDEVEKICDAVAIVDRGSVVWQGPIDAIRGGGRATLLVEVDDIPTALALLGEHAVDATDDGLRVALPADDLAHLAAEINRTLVAAGLAVRRLEPSRASLEERFLEITSRLEEAA